MTVLRAQPQAELGLADLLKTTTTATDVLRNAQEAVERIRGHVSCVLGHGA
jgi:hypothetical protein